MPLRRIPCRLTVEFVVDVDSITEDAAHEYASELRDPRAASDPETWAWIGLQRRLLHALVSRPDLLQRYVKAEAQVTVSEEAGHWVHGEYGYGSGEGALDVVWEAVADLSEEDQLAWVASAEARTLVEDADLVWRAFRSVVKAVRLEVDGEAV